MTNVQPGNPYSDKPGYGLTLPEDFKPTPSVKSRANYFPGNEDLGPDEMRISFVGSIPFPASPSQAGTCIMVELGNGNLFFFDFGSNCLRNIIAMQIPLMTINDIFLTHLHVDHYADLPYMHAFTPYFGRWKPLRVYGPSGRTAELGTQAMIDGMLKMSRWHHEEFSMLPVGDGYEVDVTEFDWRKEDEVIYDKDGVTVRHWPRSHGKDGASAYRLDWNGLGFVWTGDGRPDKLTAKYAQGVDVFVTECQMDNGAVWGAKYNMPAFNYNYMTDTHHTSQYALGYMFKEVNPRCAMVTHMEYDSSLLNDLSAGVRAHWDGLFLIGAPDVVTVNVTKDAIWYRRAALPDEAGVGMPRQMPDEIVYPDPPMPRETQQEQFLRDNEISPEDYYPPGVYREQITEWPKGYTVKMKK